MKTYYRLPTQMSAVTSYTADCSFCMAANSCSYTIQLIISQLLCSYSYSSVQLFRYIVISSALTRFKHHIISRASCGQINLFHCSQCTAYIDYMCTQALGNILIKHYSSHMDNISHHTQCCINIPPLSGTCRNCITVHLAALDHFSME